jgi:hypothetical protein
MTHLLIRHRVANYATWKTVFDEHAKVRRTNGERNERLFRSEDDLNEVVLLLEWDSEENARRFMALAELRETMLRAGVLGMPEVVFMAEMESPAQAVARRSVAAMTA